MHLGSGYMLFSQRWWLFTFGGAAVHSVQSQMLVVEGNRKGLEETRRSWNRDVTGAENQNLKTWRVKDDSLKSDV